MAIRQLVAINLEDVLTGKNAILTATDNLDGTVTPLTSLGGAGAGSSSAAGVTAVAASVTSVVLAAANAARRGFLIVNDGTANLYLALAATATTAAYTVKLVAGAYWEMPTPIYTGAISGIWDVANGSARITELT